MSRLSTLSLLIQVYRAVCRAGEHAAPHHSHHPALCTRSISFADYRKTEWDTLNHIGKVIIWNAHQRKKRNLLLWYSRKEFISFSRGKALAAGIIWQRMSCNGACSDTAKFSVGMSLCSFLIACIIPTCAWFCKALKMVHNQKLNSNYEQKFRRTNTEGRNN